ncbi:type II and III secretion system protein [Rhodomicrobium vannielii ATCC 17100]|uniref:Type II and III secretion system protein n=1 Tax=Rhodomicrobium vannielii (strain ATCC 17100 / DSM 162 / LMG 4299 / NCIMB 10020 / ATH 3.1.1) TaxID=648757 RepID=E3I3D9_RHOVT|nr:type II and III secretion system protein family protein [Rhodomicrobium vannielii]ADP72587.1 type II and III secretion system protein [Rhodomicrobium vannielii ATCC 17100]
MNGPKRNGAGGARGSRTLKLLICTIFLGLGASAYATEKPPSPVPPSKQPVKKVQGFGAAAPLYHLNTQNERIDVRVVLNRSENVKVEYPFTEALVTNSDIADVVPLTNASINILGKKIGNTRLSLLDQDKRVIGIVDIEVSHDVDMLRRVMRDNPSFSNLRVAAVNGRIMIAGQASDAVALSRALALAEQFAPGQVTNAMTVASPQQVMLEVRFIEASRNLARGVGVNVSGGGRYAGGTTGVETLKEKSSITSDSTGITTNLISDLAAGLGSNLVPFGAMTGRVIGGSAPIDVTIRALESQGLARRLAEPNLVALSGDTASFLAGGEFPFPVAGTNNTITTEFKKFGIGLAFTPTVLARRQINLKIEPEVSEIDYSAAVKIGNVEVPGLSVRRASTTVELRDGQSFAIAGLMQGFHNADTRQLPWIGDVPILGALTRSTSFQKKETDLVIIVTPCLVQPMVPGDAQGSPLANRRPGNDEEFFIAGKQEVQTSRPRQDLTGHIIDYQDGPQVDTSYKRTK